MKHFLKWITVLSLTLALPIVGHGAKSKKAEKSAAASVKTSSKKATDDEELKSYLSGLQKKVVDVDEEAEPLSFGDRKSEAAESEIPLQLNTQEEQVEKSLSPYQKMFAVVGTVLLFGLVVFVLIHRSGKRGALASGARNIKVLSQKSIGPKRNLMVIKVAGESILLGVTDHNINFIKSLAILDDEMPAISPDNFSQEMEKNMEPVKEQEFSDVVDGYAVSNLAEVKDVISRRYRT